MSWLKRGGFAALVAVVAGAVLLRRRTEVWHTLSDIDQN